MKVAIRAQYPATGKYDWREALDALAPVKYIELAFHSPDNFVRFVDLESVVGPIMDLNLGVPTIHMAHASLTNLGLFIPVLIGTLKMAWELNCRNIVVHPSRGEVKGMDVLFWQAIIPLLEDYNCDILWETFSGKRRILTAWDELAKFCECYRRNSICYDICHMQRRSASEVVDDIETYWSLIEAFHFSNWSSMPHMQHLPLGDGILDFNSIVKHLKWRDFQGSITLEYLPEFHDRLVPDALRLMEKVYEK